MPQTVQNITVKVGLKPDTVTTLKVLDSDPIFQAGNCGWLPSGTTTIGDFDLKTCSERINEAYCPKDLYNTYLTTMLQPGQTETTLPYTEVMLNLKSEQISRHIEEKIWQADTDNGDCFDGFLVALASGTTGVGVSLTGTAFNAMTAYGTNGNPVYECEKLVDALDNDAMSRNDLAIFMSYANYRKYIQSLVKMNLFLDYINGGKIEGNTISYLPNSTIKIIPTVGITGSTVICGATGLMFYGVDAVGDSDNLKLWYSVDNDEVRLRCNFSYGATVKLWADTKYFSTNAL